MQKLTVHLYSALWCAIVDSTLVQCSTTGDSTLVQCTVQSCQFCHWVPQATFLDLGGLLNFMDIIGFPNEATAMRLLKLICLYEATTMRLPQVSSIRILLRQPQDNVLTLLSIIRFWFLTQPDLFLKHA